MKKLLIVSMIIAMAAGILAFAACEEVPESLSDKIELSYDSTTDYGVYWYADGKYVRSSDDMDVKYFDPQKPTFVFAHGWEPDQDNSSNGLVEDLKTHSATLAACGVEEIDYAPLLKKQGYNVACLGWFSYASSLGRLFKYIWVEFDGGYGLSVRFAEELALVLGNDYKQDVTMMGHSYGAQLAVATTYQLTKFKDDKVISNANIIPKRVTLADPYIGASALISGWKTLKTSNIAYSNEPIAERQPNALMADTIEYIVDRNDVAFDIYGGMLLAYDYFDYDGSDENFEKISENSVFTKCRGLEKISSTDVHNIVRDWLLLSFVGNVKLYDQNGDVGPTAAASNEEIKAMRGKCYNQVASVLDLSKDSLVLVDRTVTEY